MSKQDDIIKVLATIDERTKNIEIHATEMREEINKRFDSYSHRLRGLEKWRSWMAGAGAVIAAYVGVKVH